MAEDRTLEDFLGEDGAADASGDAEPEAPDDGDEAGAGTAERAVDDDPADAPLSTYRWTPGGAACAACGTTVERRWLDDDSYVCGDCKEW